MMVSVGLGWSTLPQSMVDDSIVALPLHALHMQRRLGSVHLKRRTLSRAASALMALLPIGDGAAGTASGSAPVPDLGP